MINRLQKNITVLCVTLLGLLLVAVLMLINWDNYQNNLKGLKAEVRDEIRSIGWDAFLEGETEDTILEEYSYCVVRTSYDSQSKKEIIINRFPEKTEAELIAYASHILTHEDEQPESQSYVYIIIRI